MKVLVVTIVYKELLYSLKALRVFVMWSPSHTASDAKHTKMMSREESDERAHFKKVIDAFENYRGDSVERISRTRDQIKRLPLDQQNVSTVLNWAVYQRFLLLFLAATRYEYAAQWMIKVS